MWLSVSALCLSVLNVHPCLQLLATSTHVCSGAHTQMLTICKLFKPASPCRQQRNLAKTERNMKKPHHGHNSHSLLQPPPKIVRDQLRIHHPGGKRRERHRERERVKVRSKREKERGLTYSCQCDLPHLPTGSGTENQGPELRQFVQGR